MSVDSKPSNLTWESLGDIEDGRRVLGSDMPVIVYRLFQYSVRDILEREYDKETAERMFRLAGYQVGILFAKTLLDLSGDFDYFIANLQKQLQALKIGILRVEKSDLANLTMTVTVSEDLDCSGLPVTGNTVCDYDEGFLAGILEVYSGKTFSVKEIDCWSTGQRICRFDIKSVN